MSEDPRRSGLRSSTTTSLDDLLKGEIMTRMPRGASLEHVEVMIADARRRFGTNGLWTIGALEVEHIDRTSREKLRAAFDEFRLAGGMRIIAITARPTVATAFQMAAYLAGNIPLTVVKTVPEATEASRKHRSGQKKP